MSVRTMSCGHVACSVDPKAAEGGMSRPRVGMLLKLQMFLNGECPAARPNLQAEGAVPEYGHKLAALRRRQVDTVLGRSSHTPKYHGKIESQARSGPDSKPSQDVDFGLLLQRCLQWKDIILDLISLSKSPALAAPSSRPTCSKAEQSTHTHIVYVTEASLGLSAGKVVVSSVRSSWLLQKGGSRQSRNLYSNQTADAQPLVSLAGRRQVTKSRKRSSEHGSILSLFRRCSAKCM